MQEMTAGVTAGGSYSFPLCVTVSTDLTHIDFTTLTSGFLHGKCNPCMLAFSLRFI